MLISIKWQHLFYRWLAVYSRHTVLFLDLIYSCRTLFYDAFDMTLLHLILVTAPKCGYGKCSKISNTLKLRTPKIIAENNF